MKIPRYNDSCHYVLLTSLRDRMNWASDIKNLRCLVLLWLLPPPVILNRHPADMTSLSWSGANRLKLDSSHGNLFLSLLNADISFVWYVYLSVMLILTASVQIYVPSCLFVRSHLLDSTLQRFLVFNANHRLAIDFFHLVVPYRPILVPYWLWLCLRASIMLPLTLIQTRRHVSKPWSPFAELFCVYFKWHCFAPAWYVIRCLWFYLDLM